MKKKKNKNIGRSNNCIINLKVLFFLLINESSGLKGLI